MVEYSMVECIFNNLGKCLATFPEACECRKMSPYFYNKALKRLDKEAREKENTRLVAKKV